MKILACLLLSIAALAEPYYLVYPRVEVERSVGAPGVDVHVHLHNNGGSGASCTVEAGNQTQTTGVSPYGDSTVDFRQLTNYNGVRYGCTSGR